MIDIHQLPAVNATLNGTSAVLLTCGYISIRSGNRRAHGAFMLSAVIVSLVFLISYLYYHFHVGRTHFAYGGAIRYVYFSILLSHTILAIVTALWLVPVTLSRALRERFQQHRAIARWTLPIWFYVSVTGVVVYFILYQWYPGHDDGDDTKAGLNMRILSIVVLLLLATITPTTAESISGVVRLIGHAPEIPPHGSTDNTSVCGDLSRIVPSLRLGTNQAVANVIVYLEVTSGPGAPTNVPAVLNVIHCAIEPRIQIMGNGAPLILRNSDPTLHVLQIEMINVTNPPTVLLKTALPYAGYEKHFNLERFREPKILKVVEGNDEDGAIAYVAVVPQAWSALTDGQGRFVIKGIPPGKYKTVLWHEVLGTVTREVNVSDGRASDLMIELTSPRGP